MLRRGNQFVHCQLTRFRDCRFVRRYEVFNRRGTIGRARFSCGYVRCSHLSSAFRLFIFSFHSQGIGKGLLCGPSAVNGKGGSGHEAGGLGGEKDYGAV